MTRAHRVQQAGFVLVDGLGVLHGCQMLLYAAALPRQDRLQAGEDTLDRVAQLGAEHASTDISNAGCCAGYR